MLDEQHSVDEVVEYIRPVQQRRGFYQVFRILYLLQSLNEFFSLRGSHELAQEFEVFQGRQGVDHLRDCDVGFSLFDQDFLDSLLLKDTSRLEYLVEVEHLLSQGNLVVCNIVLLNSMDVFQEGSLFLRLIK